MRSALAGLVVLSFVLGCDRSGDIGAADGGSSADLAVRDLAAPADLTTPPDLALDDAAISMSYRYVLNAMTLPQIKSEFAWDLNGDGRPDNQLGEVISVLSLQGVDLQMFLDDYIARGQFVELIRLNSSDPAQKNDDAVMVVVRAGLALPDPDFGGMGKFTLDNNEPSSVLGGALVAGVFGSEDPARTKSPVALKLKVPFFDFLPPVTLPLNGVRVEFRTGTDKISGAPGLLSGRIQGSVRERDIQTVIIPSLAQGMTQFVQMDPFSPVAEQVLMLFDLGGCGMAVRGDKKIDDCEVAQNPIVQSILAPDVEIYDERGNYAPNSKNTRKNALSVGVAFTAVRAQF